MRDDAKHPLSTPAEARIGDGIDRETLKQLGAATPWHLGTAVLLEWAWIFAAIAVAVRLDSLVATALAVAFIGMRQHALLILMHEFSHRHFSRAHPVLNDVIGDFFCALPFTITIHGFRRDHTAHHRFVSTDDDPNWTSCAKEDRFDFPRPVSSTVWTLVKHCVGFYGLSELKSTLFDAKMASACPASTRWRQVAFAVGLVAVLTWFEAWQLWAVYWVLPLLTVLVALLYWREIAEHYAMPKEGIEASRTTLPAWWERCVIGPHNVGYHTEHHLYPSVSSSKLPKLHALLKDDASFAAKAVITRGYFSGLLRESSSFGPPPQAAVRVATTTSAR